MHKLVLLLLLVLSACGGPKKIERPDYLDSREMSSIRIPNDLDKPEQQSLFDIPDAAVSLEGMTPEDLHKLKSPPDLIGANTEAASENSGNPEAVESAEAQ